jgi:four helix bundle protein
MNTPKDRFRFEKIEVWQMARRYNRAIYEVSRQFPEEERFGLTSQIRRASVSISSNIAEGSGRNSDVDFSHFHEIAYGSLMETVSQLFLSLDESFITQEAFDDVTADADCLAFKIVAVPNHSAANPISDRHAGSVRAAPASSCAVGASRIEAQRR